MVSGSVICSDETPGKSPWPPISSFVKGDGNNSTFFIEFWALYEITSVKVCRKVAHYGRNENLVMTTDMSFNADIQI